MNQADKEKMISRYKDRYHTHGYSPLALGWGRGGRQNLRFRILSEIGFASGDAILDVGCGFGDLFAYLRHKEIEVTYLGLDIVDELLEEGRRQIPGIQLRNLDILSGDVIDRFDYVVSSGIFNARLEHENNYKYIERMLSAMMQIARKGVAVDFQSSYVDFIQQGSFHTQPEKVFSIAKGLTKRVIVRHDYMPYEFSVYLYKNDQINESNIFSELVNNND